MIRVASMNERGAKDRTHTWLIPTGRVLADLMLVMQHADIIGMQEWAHNRDDLLASRTAWDSTRSAEYRAMAGPPIAWRRDRFTACVAETAVGAKGRRVGFIPGRRTTLPDYKVTWVILEDNEAPAGKKRDVFVLNAHTPAHVQYWPGPRRRMYRDYLRSISLLVEQHAKAYDVYVTGDWNWDVRSARPASPRSILAHVGLMSCWAGAKLVRPTLGRRLVDAVWSTKRATRSPVTIATASDHRAVIATY